MEATRIPVGLKFGASDTQVRSLVAGDRVFITPERRAAPNATAISFGDLGIPQQVQAGSCRCDRLIVNVPFSDEQASVLASLIMAVTGLQLVQECDRVANNGIAYTVVH